MQFLPQNKRQFHLKTSEVVQLLKQRIDSFDSKTASKYWLCYIKFIKIEKVRSTYWKLFSQS